jgi:hypothetical protein
VPESVNLLRLPALRGNDPLGFLAAVGLVAVAEQMPDELGPIRLGWSGVRTPTAVVETNCRNVDDLGKRLSSAFDRVRRDGEALPCVDPAFPPKGESTGGDPMRMDQETAMALRRQAFEEWITGRPWLSRWVAALLAPAARHRDGYCELTKFAAIAGQMRLRRNFDNAIKATSKIGGPKDALGSWRRVEGFQGANLDARAVRTAEFRTDGQPSKYGAPSPTWLALVGTRLFPITDDGRRARTTAWLDIRLYAGFTHRSLIWPTWESVLDAAAVRVLLTTETLNAAIGSRTELEARLRANASVLRGLGVTAVFGSCRRTADKGDGPLGPAATLWIRGE